MKKQIWVLLITAVMIALVFSVVSCTKKVYVVGPDQLRTTTPTAGKAERAEGEEDETDGSYRISDLSPEDEKRSLSREMRLKTEIDEFESRPIYFDFNESELTRAAQVNLSQKAAWLKSHPEYSIIIEGHCDERGGSEYNLALGERRAGTARRYLINQGISGDRIQTISYGEERPADRGHDENAWAKNRRGEFRVVR